jgi:sigma-E factor negative regulatory protein RseB
VNAALPARAGLAQAALAAARSGSALLCAWVFVLPVGAQVPERAAAAQAAPASTVEPAPATLDAKALFLRMQAAAAKSNFQGNLVVSSGGVLSSSRVTHFAVDGQVYEMLEAMDGRAHRVLRHNETVHMLWPQTQVAVIEKRQTLGAWSTTPQSVDAFALENYEPRRDGTARVAGRDALVLWMQPRDALRYAQRFWADRETGLMLRADVQSLPLQPPQVLESTAFSALDLGMAAQPQSVLQAMQPPAGYRVVRPQQQVTTLEAQGWALARPVPGFRLAGSVLRGVENAGKRDPVLHAVFTDGLTLVSLFVETFDDKLHRGEAHNQQGATSSLSQRRGEHWFTVVAAAPLPTLRLFAGAMDKRSP